MSALDDRRWPTAELDRVGRARVLSAALPGTWIEERVLPVPFEDAWAYIADLERSVPEFDSDVSALRIVGRRGTRLRIRANAAARFLSFPSWFDVELRPGWCLMWSRPQVYVIVMAAEPAGPDATRLVHVEGLAVPVPGRIASLLRPLLGLSRWRHRHHVPRDVDNIERAVADRSRRER